MVNSNLNNIFSKIEAAKHYNDAKQFTKAFEIFKALAEEGELSVQTQLCYMYLAGKGTIIDINKAFYWCTKSSKISSEGMFYLGKVYVMKNQWGDTIRCYEKAAKQNYTPAIYCLSRIYYLGINTVQDRKKSLILMEKASIMGHLMARREYGKMLILGQNGILDIPKGIFLLISWPVFAFRTLRDNIHTEKAII